MRREGSEVEVSAISPRVRPSLNFSMLMVLFIGAMIALHSGFAIYSPLLFVAVLSGWVVSLCLHEFGHAYVAVLAGDDSPRTLSYLTFDPAKYVDPFLSIVFPAIILMLGGLALPGGAVWLEIRGIHDRIWRSMISLAGPAANVMALGVLAIASTVLVNEDSQPEFDAALTTLAFIQAMAIIFNLLPIPGFDGWAVISPWLSKRTQEIGARMSGWSLMIICALIFMPGFGSMFVRTSAQLIQLLGFDPAYAAYGIERFAFWE